MAITRPIDGGTRFTVARKPDWWLPTISGSKTLVVSHNHMAVWVNGIQVSDWTDTRPPDDNPRKGLRTAPGTLILQGHDLTTDILFRNLRAIETPRRSK